MSDPQPPARGMKLNLDESVLPLIGRVTTNFGMLESTLDSAIGLLLYGNDASKQRKGNIVTRHLSFSAKIEVFGALYRDQFPSRDYGELMAFDKRLRKANGDRNHLVHSLWIGGYHSGPAIRISRDARAKRGIEFKFQPVPHEELHLLAEQLAVLANDLQEFCFYGILGWEKPPAPEQTQK